MAKKTSRKLTLKKETLRSLTAEALGRVVGGGLSGVYCGAGNGGTYTCGSTDTDTSALCISIVGGGAIIRN